MPHNIPLFLFVAFVTVVTPGPTVLLALANGSRAGMRGALYGMLGAVLSDFVLIGAVALGLGALLAASEFLFQVIKWAGVAYLAFLGLRLLGSEGGAPLLPSERDEMPRSRKDLFLKSLLVALTNPKGYLFFSALLPQFVVVEMPWLPQYLVLGAVFGVVDFLVMLGYAFLGRQASRMCSPRGVSWLERLCGGVFFILSASLALYRRQG